MKQPSVESVAVVVIAATLSLWIGLSVKEVEGVRQDARQMDMSMSKIKEIQGRHIDMGICKVTAYSNDPKSINVPEWRDGKTATGKPVKVGICAADWGILPPGTLIWIESVGPCIIEDRGGAVKGMHIDVYMGDDAYEKAREFGVQQLRVWRVR